MASIRITRFAGLLPEVNSRLKPEANAQIAHNCLLTDGSLRPQAQWIQQSQYDSGFEPTARGIAYDRNGDAAVMYRSFDPITLVGQPFADLTTVGAGPSSLVQKYLTGAGQQPTTSAVYGGGVSGVVLWERQFDSVKPVNRLYAVSRVRRINGYTEEGTLIPLAAQNPTAIMYEGDLVTVTMNASALDDGANFIRLYRSITGLDTGQAVANQLDTNWHLVAELPLLAGNEQVYIDGNSATAAPLDVYYAGQFHPMAILARHFGLTESGWFVTASSGGDIAVSERYKHHAWPVENYYRVPMTLVDIAVHLDNVYIGTTSTPYVLSLAAGEKALQGAAVPFPEFTPCLPNTMAAAAGGAIFASGQGIIALSREGQRVLSSEIANAGDVLYTKEATGGTVTARIDNTSFGAYYQGKYFAFCEAPPIDDGYYLTSTLYPVQITERMAVDSIFADARSLENTIDHMGLDAVFSEGVLRAVLQDYVMPPTEDGSGIPNDGLNIASDCSFNEGVIASILITTAPQVESMQAFSELTQGNLVDILVTTQAPPDSMQAFSELIQGNLT